MNIKKHFFTLFELLISIALLVILSLVLMRMFVLTSDYWSASDEQARLFSDAKTVLSIISDDLDNIVYQDQSALNPPGASDVTAPLWLTAYATQNPIYSYQSYWKKGNLNTKGRYAPALYMVTRSNMVSTPDAVVNDGSGIHQVAYYFMPPTQDGQKISNRFSGNGVLLRACYTDQSGKPYYGFVDRLNGTKMNEIFSYSVAHLQEVVTGILDLRIMAFPEKKDDEYWNEKRGPISLRTVGNEQIDLYDPQGDLTPSDGQSDLTGAKKVRTIQIVLKLMPENRIPEFRNLCQAEKSASGTAQQECTRLRKEYEFKYARTFRKTVQIRNLVSEE